MKLRVLLILTILFIVSGCSISESGSKSVTKDEGKAIETYLDKKYGDEFDWTLKKGRKRTDKILELEYTEYHEQYKRAGLDLTPFADEKVTVYFFDLKPTCKSDSDVYRFNLVVYRNDSEFVGEVMTVKAVVGGPLETAGIAEVFEMMDCK